MPLGSPTAAPVPGITSELGDLAKDMPPAQGFATPTPVDLARADLAIRLHADIALVELVSLVKGAPDGEAMPCLTDGRLAEELWSRVEEVAWITLSVKGSAHHYVGVGNRVIYCEHKRQVTTVPCGGRR